MNRFISLTKVLLKTNLDSLVNKKGKYKLKGVLVILLLTMCFIPLVTSIGALVNTIYTALFTINQQSAILGLGLAMSSTLIFVFGVFYVIGTFYFSMDIEYLLPLPLKPLHILGSKLVVVVIYEYLTELIFLAPLLITYGFKNNGGFLYYIISIVIFLILPVIPLVVSSILVMIVMRFTTFAKNKDRFNTIAGIVALFISLALTSLMEKAGANFTSPEQIQKLFLEGNNSLLTLTTKIFPSSQLAALALAETSSMKGLINLILFILITLAVIAIFIILGEALYLKGVIGISQSSSKRKNLSNKEFSKVTKPSSLLKAYTVKELKLLFRTPSYFMNCILMNFLWPIFIIFPILFDSEETESLGMISEFINNPDLFPLILTISSLIIVFVAATNSISSTAISREGKNIYITKYLPISYKTQIFSKALSGIIMGLVGMFMLIISLYIIAKPSSLLTLLIILIGALAIPSVNFVGILIDLYNPKLYWDNEQKAVKQNVNTILSWLPSLAIGGLLIFMVYKLNLNLTITSVLLVVVYTIMDLVLYKTLAAKGEKIFRDL